MKAAKKETRILYKHSTSSTINSGTQSLEDAGSRVPIRSEKIIHKICDSK